MTGPPSLLAPCSVVEAGRCWAERPGVLAAPALESCPRRRALLVLRWFLISLRSQLYFGAVEPADADGSKPGPEPRADNAPGKPSLRKPLNAFLGELFFASWTDRDDTTTTTTATTTHLVAEQVSHHPPITAVHVADRAHGVRADGYARVEMTFGAAAGVLVRRIGHATLRLDRVPGDGEEEGGKEDWLVPLPDVRVRGFFSAAGGGGGGGGGGLYPEVEGTYHLASSGAFAAEVRFFGEGWGGRLFGWPAAAGRRRKRNSFEARVYRKTTGAGETPREERTEMEVVYEVAGVWSEGWTVRDGRTGEVVEEYAVDGAGNGPAAMEIAPVEEQDPWESRRAWAGVLRGLRTGDMRTVVAEKSRIEQAQREMRASEAARGVAREPLLFRSRPGDEHEVFHRLAERLDWQLHADKTKGVWRVDDARLTNLRRPFRPGLTPLGYLN